MSNRQARRDQMRSTRQQRAQQTRQAGPRKSSGPSRGGGGISTFLSNKFALLAGAVVIVLAVILGIVIANAGSSNATIVSELQAAGAAFPFDQAKGYKVGADSAPVKLTEFEDFQCPFCLRYTGQEEPAIMTEFVKTGKVQIEFKHLPILGAESVRAAKAAECAAQQDKFWQLHNDLFLTQAKAGQATAEKTNVGRFSDANLRAKAITAGVDGAKYDACFASEATLQAVQASQAEASKFGITGTPGFLINGSPIGSGAPSTIEGWRSVFDAALKQLASPTASATTAGSATASASASAAGSPGASATSPAPSATTAAASVTPTPTKGP